jgi:adenosyl cobinamide kinase/adenosyl cobinamide phosphate guanylyltransferase
MKLEKVLVVLALATACGTADHEATARWPNHRKQEEQRISVLEEKIKLISVLEKRLRELEATIEQLRQPASRPAPQ